MTKVNRPKGSYDLNSNVRKPIMLLIARYLIAFSGIFQNDIFNRLCSYITLFFLNQCTSAFNLLEGNKIRRQPKS